MFVEFNAYKFAIYIIHIINWKKNPKQYLEKILRKIQQTNACFLKPWEVDSAKLKPPQE